jgi:phospholipid/cholesterol/gamma-HCH transport system substrate-binding protein
MLMRRVKIQLIAFVVIAILGISYVGGKYAGLGTLFSSGGCTVSADFTDSGGIFTGAEVTYRGVTVGKVGQLHLIDKGVRADLHLTKGCNQVKIAASASATVSDRSAVGEQYVNLIPPNSNPPYLEKGAVIPMSRTTIPVPTQVLLTNLDLLASSVNTANLTTVLGETTKALNDKGTDLKNLLDAGNELLNSAIANLEPTIKLIQESGSVLQTQLDLNAPLQSWAKSLDELTATLKSSDPDLRRLLTNGPGDFDVIQSFVKANSGDIGVLLSNLDTTGQVVTAHLAGVEEVLELYPAIVAGGATVARNCTTGGGLCAQFGLVTNVNDPPDCESGYGGTVKRDPSNATPEAPNASAQCTNGGASDIRGAQNVPGGDPVDTSGSSIVVPRAITANTVKVGDKLDVGTGSDGKSSLLGDNSWLTLLTDGLN